MPIVNRVSMVMGAQRMTMAEVIRRTGISRTGITDIYHGRTASISMTSLARLCQVLGCQPGDLLEFVPGADGDGPGVA